MGELAGISGKETIKRLMKFGYSVVRQRGSHVRMHATGKPPITIPLHKELKLGLLRQIIKDAGMSVEDFLS